TGETGWYPLLSLGEGEEDCYALVTPSGAEIWQSKSTGMDMPDGSAAKTPDMYGKPVHEVVGAAIALTHVMDHRHLGVRRVLMPDFGNRMFFAGRAARACIATHNIMNK